VFISSKTEILNDGLLTDQIISLSNGNIQQYEIISEIQIKNNSEYAVTTKSKVSISKLTSFIESKGIEVEFKGSIFAMNIKIQQLNEESEVNAIKEMSIVLKNISDRSFDFSIEPEVEPTLNQNNTQKWDIPLLIKVKLNSNFENYKNYFIKTLKAISLNIVEAKNYIDL
jgi:ribosomal protein L7/L12